MGVGSVQSTGSVNAVQQPGNEKSSVKHSGADNPGRVNRHSITKLPPTTQLKTSQLYPSLESKALSEYGVSPLAASDVKAKMTLPPVPAELSPKENIMFGRASRVIGRINTELRKGGYEPQVRSEETFKVRISQARDSVKVAESMLKQACGLDKDATLSMNMRDSGLGAGRLTVAGKQAESAIMAATGLLKQRKEELRQAKSELSSLKSELKQKAKTGRKARAAEEKLETKTNVFKKAVSSIRADIHKATNTSSRAVGKELASVESALKKAKSARSSGNKLLRGMEREAGKHGFNIDSLRTQARQSRETAGSEIVKLKAEVVALKTKKKAAQTQEKKDRRADKSEQKELNQAHKKMNREFDKSEARSHTSGSSKQERVKLAATPTPTRKPTVTPSSEPVKRGTTASQKTALQPLQPSKANVARYVADIKPSQKLSFSAIDKSMKSVRTVKEYKQVLADINAAKLGLGDKTKLRGFLSAALLGAMKDPVKFQHLTPELIEHTMYGLSKNEIEAEYPKAVAREKQRLTQNSRSFNRG